MLVLYDKEKRTKEFDLTEPALDKSATRNLLLCTQQLLSQRGEFEAAGLLEKLDFSLFNATNFFNDKFSVLNAQVPFEEYEYFRKVIEDTTNDATSAKLAQLFELVTSAIAELGIYVRFVTCQLDLSRPPIVKPVSNQALFTFSDSPKVTYAGLNFRSKAEIRIFETLAKRGLLILPLPIAVMGEIGKHREPDFVVFYNGKAGILEIHGDKWHPPETAATEHERRRTFTRLGINVYEIFGAERCWNDPEGVVEDFLQAFMN
jgi:hypothetical protein